MTSLRSVTHLFLFMSTMDLSKAGCNDYFVVKEWGDKLTETISLIDTKDDQDMMECTVEREVIKGRKICYILLDCFNRSEEPKEISEKCKGDTTQTVAFYHFMCLTAKAIKLTPKGCEYDIVCRLLAENKSTAFGQKTTLSILPTTTTILSPTTTLPERTTAWPPPPTTTATQNEVSVSNGQTLHRKVEPECNPCVKRSPVRSSGNERLPESNTPLASVKRDETETSRKAP